MRKIIAAAFVSLDGVMQAPGGPDEDPEGFPFGGWQAPLMDEVAGQQVMAAYEGTDALLLGRRTYDIFASYWPHQEGGQDDDIATLFNRIPKYVASRGTPSLSWAGSTQLGPDLPAAVREVRDRHEHVKVVGSLASGNTFLTKDTGTQAGYTKYDRGPFAGPAYVKRATFGTRDGAEMSRMVVNVPSGTVSPAEFRTRSLSTSLLLTRNPLSACAVTRNVRPSRLKSLT